MPHKHKRNREEAFTASLIDTTNDGEPDNNKQERTHKKKKRKKGNRESVNPNEVEATEESYSVSEPREVVQPENISLHSPVTKVKLKHTKKSKHKTKGNANNVDAEILQEKLLEVECHPNKNVSVAENIKKKRKKESKEDRIPVIEISGDSDSTITMEMCENSCSGELDWSSHALSDPPKKKHKKKLNYIDLHDSEKETWQRDTKKELANKGKKKRKKKHKKENKDCRGIPVIEISGDSDCTITKEMCEDSCIGELDEKKKKKKHKKNKSKHDAKQDAKGLANCHPSVMARKEKPKRCNKMHERVDGCFISHPGNTNGTANTGTWKREKGKKYNNGRWSKSEDVILDENLERIGQSIGAVDLKADLFKDVYLKNGDVIQWSSFLKATDFYETIQYGLHRDKRSILSYLFYIKRSFAKSGVFSQKETKKLKKLYSKYGKKWTLISTQFGRNTKSLERKMLSLKSWNRGPWLDEETMKLRHAVQVLTEAKEGTPIYKNINWPIVSCLVGTRNYNQCRSKWTLCPRSTQRLFEAPKWSTRDNFALIEAVYNSDVSHEGDIEWDMIYSSWQNSSVVSPQRLSYKWGLLKAKYLTDPRNMEFEEIIDELYHVVLPQLKSELEHEKKCIEDSKKGKKRKKK